MIWITQKDGRLGNRLILFSHLISFSGATGIPVYYPAFEEYGSYFCGPRLSPFSRYPVKNSLWESIAKWKRAAYIIWRLASRGRRRLPPALRPGNVRRAMTFDQRIYLDSPEFTSLAKRCRFLFLEGNYFRCQNRQWLQVQEAAIKDFFKPVEPHGENSHRQAQQARADADILVGVHIRQGDYRTFYQGRYFYSISQYRAVMEKVARLFPVKKVNFLVCSDEAYDARAFSPFHVTAGSRHFIEDLYSLAQCDYLAGAPSTFSKWASYYGGVPLYDIMDPGAAMALDDFKVFKLI